MEKEKIIYFVRHGESEANIAPIFQAPDSQLSEKGKEQAKLIAKRAANIDFDSLISSPWARTKATAEEIQKTTGKEPSYSELFVERIKPHSINGKPYNDPEAMKLCKEWEDLLYVSGAKRVEDGENYDDLVERADKALKYLLDRKEDKILVVTHGYFLRVLVARVLLGDLLTGELHKAFQKSARIENTGITVLKYTKESAYNENFRWKLWIFNDHAHLG